VQREKKREREKTENFRAQFFLTGMSKIAGVFFSLSLFLSFSLVRSQKYPLPTIISCTHPIIQISHLPPFKNSWNAVAINSKKGWPWVREQNKCREGVFLREKQRKREKERKQNTSAPKHFSSKELCSKKFLGRLEMLQVCYHSHTV
jgi:hypothetical protein